MPKNNPAAKNKMVTPKVKGSFWNRDMSMLTTLVPLKYLPVDWIDVPARTHVDVSPKIDIESLPAVSPLYDGWTLETYYYFVPYRLYMPTLRINNVVEVGDIDNEVFPTMTIRSRKVDGQAPQSGSGYYPVLPFGSLMHRLGYQPADLITMRTFANQSWGKLNDGSYRVTMPTTENRAVSLNMIPLLAYLDTWLYGQFNKQDKLIPTEPDSWIVSPIDTEGQSAPYLYVTPTTLYFEYSKLKDFMNTFAYGKSFLSSSSATNGFGKYDATKHNFELGDITVSYTTPAVNLFENYSIFTNVYDADGGVDFQSVSDVLNFVRKETANRMSNVGLLPVTYYGDKFTSWFDAESVNKLKEYTVSSGENYLTLRRENANMLIDMIAMVSGNDYRSYLKFIYDTDLDFCDHPILVGKDSLSFGFMDVLNQSANVDTSGEVSDVNQALAFTAGKARSKNNNVRDINFKTREPGMFMVLCALRPTVRYFQGQDDFLFKRKYAELWHPQYSSTGFDQLKLGEAYLRLVGTPTQNDAFYVDNLDRDKVALDAYIPVGWEYQTNIRKLGGAMVLPRFRTWSLARDFSLVGYSYDDYNSEEIDVLMRSVKSSYGNRSNFDFNFVDTSAEAQNFIMNFSAKVRCFQPMSKVLVKTSV